MFLPKLSWVPSDQYAEHGKHAPCNIDKTLTIFDKCIRMQNTWVHNKQHLPARERTKAKPINCGKVYTRNGIMSKVGMLPFYTLCAPILMCIPPCGLTKQ